MYMSYCRFEGTRRELAVCLNEVIDHVNEEAEYEVSDPEIRHFKNMIVNFVDFLHDMCLLDDDGYLDREELDKVCQAMAKSYKEEEE
jgi:hypothetical protein